MKTIGSLLALVFLISVSKTNCCFIIHFVYYGNVTEYDYERITNFNYPYIFHLDEEINLPDGYAINRTLTQVQKSDLKKMEVIYHHGGLYIDNDHFIDVQCVKNALCPLKGMHVLDWNDRANGFWLDSVPISFIYSSSSKSQTIRKILTSYNQSTLQTIYFSGPYHVQKYRDLVNFVKISQNCEFHIGIQSWNSQKNYQYNWVTKHWKKLNGNRQKTYKLKIFQRTFFDKLWRSHSIIYPKDFNMSSLSQNKYQQFNHVQLTDINTLSFKVIQYSNLQQVRQKIEKLQQFYKDNQKIIKDQIQSNLRLQQLKQSERNSIKQYSEKIYFILLIKPQLSLLISFGFLLLINLSVLFCCKFKRDAQKVNQLQQSVVLQKKNMQQQLNQRRRHKKLKRISLCILILLIISMIMFICQIVYYNKTKQQKYFRDFIKSYGIDWYPQQKQNSNYVSLQKLGISKNIHIDSIYDYMNISQTQQFLKYKKQFLNTLKYSVYSFNFNDSLEKPPTLAKFTEIYDQKHMYNILSNMDKWGKLPRTQNMRQLYLASFLTYKNFSKTIKQMEHSYYNLKFNFDDNYQEYPMCIVTTKSELRLQSKMQDYFSSIQRQNYSNYQILLIDDNSEDQQYSSWYEYLKNSNLRLKNRIKIIRNHKKMGPLLSHYAYTRKFCRNGEIVVNLQFQDRLVGYQALKVINSIFQTQNVWIFYARSFIQKNNQTLPKFKNTTLPILQNFDQYRIDLRWVTEGLKAYRHELIQKVPIEQFLDYQFDKNTSKIYPKFPQYAGARFLTYSLLELCGKRRTKYIQQVLTQSYQNQAQEPCIKELIRYNQFKAKTKRSLKPLTTIRGRVEYQSNRIHERQLQILWRDSFTFTDRCLKIFHMQQNLM